MNILGKHRKNKPFNRCGEITHTWKRLQDWYQTRLGKVISAQEKELVENALSNLFGYHLLQVGRLNEEDWLTTSRVSHCEVMDFPPENLTMNTRGFQGLPEHLPIQTDSMDVMVLPHILEFSQYPHDVLREVDRVLVPEGHVVLLVFNPFSLWSFWKMVPAWRNRVPWCGRFLSTTRVKDWLALLGFEVTEVHGYFYRPALQQMSIMQRLGLIERLGGRVWPIFGAANLILAKKRVMTLTPVGRSWVRSKPIVSPPGLVEPFQNKTKHE